MAMCTKRISFAGVVQGCNYLVRVTHDDLIHAVDLVGVISGKNSNDSGQTLRRLPNEMFRREKIIQRRNAEGIMKKLIGFSDAIELIMVLPGKTAKNIRKQFANIIVRYLDGDRSMCHEIEENSSMGQVNSYSRFAGETMKMVHANYKEGIHEMPPTDYVYATKSPAFPGLVKIGKTENLTHRLSGLNTSCTPSPHVFVAVAQTFNKDRDEKMAHMFFSGARREGEFFELSDDEVISYFAIHITAQYNAELVQHIARLQGR